MLEPRRIRRELDKEIKECLRRQQGRGTRPGRGPVTGLLETLLAVLGWPPRQGASG
jgi:hypothetical protein